MTDEQKDHVRLWVAALRSGEFKQTTDMLRANDHYCCLGVACEIYRRETGSGSWTAFGAFIGAHGRSNTALPTDVRDWFGQSSNSPRSNLDVAFSDMNDVERDDFAIIADAIEQTYLEDVD